MAQAAFFRPSALAAGIVKGLTRRPTRTIALPLTGAVIGLGLALGSLLAPASRPVTVVPPGYAALVNQRPILMNDFITQAEATANVPFAQTTQAQRRAVLKSMIDEELLVQRALALDLPEQSTDVRVELIVALTAIVFSQRQPTEKDLLDYFNAHRDHYTGNGQMRFHDIVLHVGGYENVDQSESQAEADAAEAVYQLRAGTPLPAVMQHFGFVDSGHTSGTDEIDFAVKLHLGEKLFDVAAMLTDGEISDPVPDADGVHVIVMEQRMPPHPTDFAANRNAVYADYRQATQAEAEQSNLKFLRANAQILLAPGTSE